MTSAPSDSPNSSPPPSATDIPGPRGEALRSSLERFREAPLKESTWYHRTFGDVVAQHVGPFVTIFLFDPAHVRQVLVERSSRYSKETRAMLMVRSALGNGLITSNPPEWKRQRQLSKHGFSRKALKSFLPMMNELATGLVERWQHEGLEAPVDAPKGAGLAMLDVIGRVLMSTDFADDKGSLREATNMLTRNVNTPGADLLKWAARHQDSKEHEKFQLLHEKFFEARRTIDAAIKNVIYHRRNNPGPSDIVRLLLGARDDTGSGFTDSEVSDQIRNLFVAGHETTMTGLSMTLYLLAQHPEVLRRVREEAETVVRGAEPTAAELDKLVYLEAVVSEALRLYPPAGQINRRVLEEDEVGGYKIPKGATVSLSQWVTHRRPDIWPDADRFLPDRFLTRPPPYPTGTYFPFSLGPRICIGRALTLMELKIFLFHITKRLDLRCVDGFELKVSQLFLLQPVNNHLPLWMRPR